MKKGSLHKELEELSPRLSEMKQRDDGFRTPDGYFESLEESVFRKMETLGSQREPLLSVTRGGGLRRWLLRPQIMIAAAAVFVIVLSAKWFFSPKPVLITPTLPVVAQQLTEEEMIEAYVLENIRDFDVDQLAALAPEPLNDSPQTQDLQGKKSPSIDDLSAEELELLLKEMSDEELESLL